jgi:hypothetical protein
MHMDIYNPDTTIAAADLESSALEYLKHGPIPGGSVDPLFQGRALGGRLALLLSRGGLAESVVDNRHQY